LSTRRGREEAAKRKIWGVEGHLSSCTSDKGGALATEKRTILTVKMRTLHRSSLSIGEINKVWGRDGNRENGKRRKKRTAIEEKGKVIVSARKRTATRGSFDKKIKVGVHPKGRVRQGKKRVTRKGSERQQEWEVGSILCPLRMRKKICGKRAWGQGGGKYLGALSQ